METTLLSSHHFAPQLFTTTPVKLGGGRVQSIYRFYHPLCTKSRASVKLSLLDSKKRQFVLVNRPFLSRANKRFSINSSDQLRSDYMNVEASSAQSVNLEAFPLRLDDGTDSLSSHDVVGNEGLRSKPKMFSNRFLNFVRVSSVINNAAESFFKSEIRRRLFVTAVLIVISRVGYFIPLPGFDRRLIPQDYLSFVSGSVDELGDFGAELKLSFFQLGISPQIVASILMQVFRVVLLQFRSCYMFA